jgi:hypothetical protein
MDQAASEERRGGSINYSDADWDHPVPCSVDGLAVTSASWP